MDNKKIISEALLDLAKTSITKIIDSKDDKELINLASKLGIVIPSPDLAVIKTVYAEIDKVNRNGVVLPKNAVEKGLPTLIGKNINWEHDGAGRICGYIIDAKIVEDKIEIIGVIFKSLFPDEMDGVKEKFESKELAVSFEIWNRNPDNGESVIHDLENGYRSIDPITFHGCGLLIANKPACPKAIVYKLVASKEVMEAEKIVDKIFDENLICASMAIEEPKCKNCTTCTCEKKEVKIVEEIVKIEEKAQRLCPECKEPMKDDEEDLCAVCKTKKEEKEKSSEETQTKVAPVETKTEETPKVETEAKVEEPIVEVKSEEKSEVAETKTEETKVEETKEEVVEEKKEEAVVVTTTQEVTKVEDIKPEGEIITTEVKTEEKVVDDKGNEMKKVVEEIKTVETYTFEQVQEAVRIAEEEKDKEISTLKEELEKVKTELGQKTQELAKLTIIEEPKVEKTLTVGLVETESMSEVKKQAANINKIIAGKHK